MQDTIQSFSQMLRTSLGERLRPGLEGFVDMLAPDAVMEFPFAPDGLPRRLEGRAAIEAYLARLGAMIAFDHIGAAIVHAGSDPDMVVLEFEGFGRGIATDEAYAQRYVSLIRLRDGEIVHYRDYWDPLQVLQALRGRDFAQTLTVEGYDHG